jgi:hypothetical protein
MEEIMSLLKKKIRHVSPSLLISTAQSIQLSTETLDFLSSVEVDWYLDASGVKKLGVFLKQT